jgi:hypothetical protein
MTKRIRVLLAGLALATAATAGITLAADTSAAPPDTTWGAPATSTVTDEATTPETPVVVPLDTTWG